MRTQTTPHEQITAWVALSGSQMKALLLVVSRAMTKTLNNCGPNFRNGCEYVKLFGQKTVSLFRHPFLAKLMAVSLWGFYIMKYKLVLCIYTALNHVYMAV